MTASGSVQPPSANGTSGAGELELMAAPQDEGFAGVAFQSVEHLGDGRLRDVVLFGGAGEAVLFDEIAEQFQGFNLHENP
jgi:hypothetical protein